MTFEGNDANNGKLSEKKMEEEEDSLRKVECLRGRLLAERVASRNAKQEALNMGNKMIELETKLREETKSRNKAEKKLKFLTKKLESKNISYISDEISIVNSQDTVCQESVGSTKSSYENAGNNCSSLCCSDSLKMLSHSCQMLKKCTTFGGFDMHSEALLKNPSNVASSHDNENPSGKEHCAKSSYENVGNNCSSLCCLDSPKLLSHSCQILKKYTTFEGSGTETILLKNPSNIASSQDNENPSAKEHCAKSSELEFSKSEGNSLKSSIMEEEQNGGNQVDFQEDNSLALVPMDQPKTKQNIDPIVLDDTVREVLDALRHAKEKLQTQMERRQMIKAS